MRRKMAEQAACDELSILTDGKKGCPTKKPDISNVPCTGGQAGEYECEMVDLLAFVPVADMATTGTNDIWGWTDPMNGNEVVIIGGHLDHLGADGHILTDSGTVLGLSEHGVIVVAVDHPDGHLTSG